MYQLTIKQSGVKEIQSMLSRLQQSTEDLTPVWPRVEEEFRQIEAQQFASEGGDGQSGEWAALQTEYAAWKRDHFPTQTILRRTDTLFHSLIGRGPGSFVESLPTTLIMGTDVPYAAYHQFEGMAKNWRPPISLTDKSIARLHAVIHRYFNAHIMKSGSEQVGIEQALMGL